MAEIIGYLIMNAIRTYAIYDFINNFLYVCRVPKAWLAFGFAFYYGLLSYIHLQVGNPYAVLFANLIICFVMCLLYKASLWKQLLATVFIYILSMVSEDLVINTMRILLYVLPSHTTVPADTTGIETVISMVLLLLLVKLVKPLFRYRDIPLPPFYWLALFLIPSCSIGIQSLMLQVYQSSPAFLIPYEMCTLLLFSINVLVFYLYNQLIKGETMRYENMLLSQQNNAYENQALLIHDFQNTIRKQRHDMNNHLAAIMELAKKSEGTHLQQYIHALLDVSTSAKSGISSENPIIDAMVNSKLYLASQQHTQLHTNILLEDTLEISRVDLTVLLGNLLDNALEACNKIPESDRSIWLFISAKHGTLIIQITNTYYPADLDIRNGRIYTTKGDKETHGIGISNVHQVVEKYHGNATFTQIKKDCRDLFVAELLLYLSPHSNSSSYGKKNIF